jgi:hypothetical protein
VTGTVRNGGISYFPRNDCGEKGKQNWKESVKVKKWFREVAAVSDQQTEGKGEERDSPAKE